MKNFLAKFKFGVANLRFEIIYIAFYNRIGISYYTNNDRLEAKNLGKAINTKKMDDCPFVDSRTNTLYFTSKQDHTKIDFKTPLSVNELLKEFYNYDNGLSRLYKIQNPSK